VVLDVLGYVDVFWLDWFDPFLSKFPSFSFTEMK